MRRDIQRSATIGDSQKLFMVCNKPLKTALLYDFFMFVQLLALIVFGVGVGRLALFIDRMTKKPTLTPLIIDSLEWIAKFSVIKK